MEKKRGSCYFKKGKSAQSTHKKKRMAIRIGTVNTTLENLRTGVIPHVSAVITGPLRVGGFSNFAGLSATSATLTTLSTLNTITTQTAVVKQNLTVEGQLFLSQTFTPANIATPGTLSVGGLTSLIGGVQFAPTQQPFKISYGQLNIGDDIGVITFFPTYFAVPVVLVTPMRDNSDGAMTYIRSLSTGGVTWSTKNASGAAANANYNYIVIGLR
jgi:hypothetical protein